MLIGLISDGSVGQFLLRRVGALFRLCEASMDEARSGRDELPDDDVLFETVERVGGGADGCARQHLDGVLEG